MKTVNFEGLVRKTGTRSGIKIRWKIREYFLLCLFSTSILLTVLTPCTGVFPRRTTAYPYPVYHHRRMSESQSKSADVVSALLPVLSSAIVTHKKQNKGHHDGKYSIHIQEDMKEHHKLHHHKPEHHGWGWEEEEEEDELKKLIGVVGPVLFPVPFLLAAIPLAIPAIALTTLGIRRNITAATLKPSTTTNAAEGRELLKLLSSFFNQ